MGGAWIIFWSTFIIINLWESAAITNNRRSKAQDGAVRNFRHIESSSPYTNTDWEIGLREATNQALLRERYHAPDLRLRLQSAPLIGKQDAATPFGDVAIVARGQLYVTVDGEFAFVQDRYQNDCEGCHTARRRCTRTKCQKQTLDRHRDERMVALWTVKRLRHRDYANGYRYETEYTISPVEDPVDQPIDYAIPGHVFVVKHDHNSALDAPPRSPPATVYNRRIPHHNFRPEVLIGVGADGREHFLHSYPGFYTSFPVHPTHHNTNDPREIELYRALIEALASKTSTTQKDGPHRFSLNQYGDSVTSQTPKVRFPADTQVTMVPVRFPTTNQQARVTKPTVLQMVPTKSTALSSQEVDSHSEEEEVTHPITTVHYFAPVEDEYSATTDRVETIGKPTSTQKTAKDDGADFLFNIEKSISTSKTTKKYYKPAAGKDADTQVFPEPSPAPTRQSKVYHATFSAGKTTKTSPAPSETTKPMTSSKITPSTSETTTRYTPIFKSTPPTSSLNTSHTLKLNTPPSSEINTPTSKLITPPSSELNTPTSKLTTPPSSDLNTPTSKLPTPPSSELNTPTSKLTASPSSKLNKPTSEFTTPPASNLTAPPSSKSTGPTTTTKNLPSRPKLIRPTIPPEKITSSTVKLTTPSTTTSKVTSSNTTPSTTTTSRTTPPISQLNTPTTAITPSTLKLTTTTASTSELSTPKPTTTYITPTITKSTTPIATTIKTTPTTFKSVASVTPRYKAPPSKSILTTPKPITVKMASARSFKSKITSKFNTRLGKNGTRPLILTALMSKLQTTSEPTAISSKMTTIGLTMSDSTTLEPTTMETTLKSTTSQENISESDDTLFPMQLKPTRPMKMTLNPQTELTEAINQLQPSSNDTQITTSLPGTVATSEKTSESTTKTIETDNNTSAPDHMTFETLITSTLMPTTEEYTTSTSTQEEETSTSAEHATTTIGTTTSSAPTKENTPKPVSLDDFLGTGKMKNPVHKQPVRVEYSEDDIFGSTEDDAKPTMATTMKITESEFAGELFGDRKRSPKTLGTVSSSMTGAKVIFSDFFEASTASMLEIGADEAAAPKMEPLTSQSFATSISFEVNKRNKTKVDRTTSENVATTDDDVEFSTETSTTSDSVGRETKKVFDEAALQLVNHVRSINYVNGLRNGTKKVKYKRRRTYVSKSRKMKKKQ